MRTKLLLAMALLLAGTLIYGQDLTTASGIKCTTLKPGSGAKPAVGQDYHLHVVVTKPDGSELFSSRLMNVPVHGTVGEDKTKEGLAFDEVLKQTMQQGGKYRLHMPKSVLDDDKGAESLGVEYLTYEIEMLDITPAKPSGTDVLKEVITTEGVEAAKARYEQLRSEGASAYVFDEWDLNGAGYDMLRAENAEAAIALFEINVQLNPNSWNAHDSLGDAHVANGDKDRARASYEQALKLNPNFTSSKDKLDKL